MFRGHFHHTIDPKGRLSIPAKFREELGNGFGESEKLVIAPGDDCLEVHPLRNWEEIEARAAAMPEFDEDVLTYQQFYISRGLDVTIDPQGRIQIPQEYRERAGLTKDVLVMGFLNRLHVWDVDRWSARERAKGAPISQIRARLAAKNF